MFVLVYVCVGPRRTDAGPPTAASTSPSPSESRTGHRRSRSVTNPNPAKHPTAKESSSVVRGLDTLSMVGQKSSVSNPDALSLFSPSSSETAAVDYSMSSVSSLPAVFSLPVTSESHLFGSVKLAAKRSDPGPLPVVSASSRSTIDAVASVAPPYHGPSSCSEILRNLVCRANLGFPPPANYPPADATASASAGKPGISGAAISASSTGTAPSTVGPGIFPLLGVFPEAGTPTFGVDSSLLRRLPGLSKLVHIRDDTK